MPPRREGVFSLSFPSFVLLDFPVNFLHILDVVVDPLLLFPPMEEDGGPLGGVAGATGLELDDNGVTRSTGSELEEEEYDLLTTSGTAFRSDVGDRIGRGSGSESLTGSSLIDAALGIFVEDLLWLIDGRIPPRPSDSALDSWSSISNTPRSGTVLIRSACARLGEAD